MKLINIEYLKSLKPCKNRLDNAIKYYSKFEGDILDVLSLDNISSEDKVWLASKVLPDNILHRFSIECAYSTLDNFESKFPNDLRPRKAIEAKQAWLNNEISDEELEEVRSASLSASYSALHSASSVNAASSASSASSALYLASHSAANSASYSAAFSAAFSASWSSSRLASHSAANSATNSANSANSATSRSQQYGLLINKLINLIEIDILLGEL